MNQTSDSQQENKSITWKAALPLITNAVVIRQLSFVLVISVLCVLLFILSLDAFEGNLTLAGAWRYMLIALLTLGGFAFLAVLAMLVFYGNKYEYKFTLNEIGVLSETVDATRKKNNIINLLLVLSGRPGPAGAGLIAHSRQSELVKWEKVDSLTTNPANLEIVLRRGRRAVMVIRCTQENYPTVLQMAEEALAAKS